MFKTNGGILFSAIFQDNEVLPVSRWLGTSGHHGCLIGKELWSEKKILWKVLGMLNMLEMGFGHTNLWFWPLSPRWEFNGIWVENVRTWWFGRNLYQYFKNFDHNISEKQYLLRIGLPIEKSLHKIIWRQNSYDILQDFRSEYCWDTLVPKLSDDCWLSFKIVINGKENIIVHS